MYGATMSLRSSTSLAVAAATLCLCGAASAQIGPLHGSILGSVPSGVSPSVVGNFVDVNVAGIQSFGLQGVPGNAIVNVNVGANNQVIGIGWNVNVTAFAPSYLSELGVGFTNTAQTAGVNLLVGVGDDFPGANVPYTSGGVLDLVGLGLNFNVGANGVLRLEFFEDFDDVSVNPDGRWNSGNLTLQLTNAVPVPEPSTYGLMALGLLGVAAAAARRKGATA